MKTFFSDLGELINFVQIPKVQKSVVFYSEGRDSWLHLEGLIREFLRITDRDICYISSDIDDPGLLLEDPQYKSFNINKGHILNWLFRNIETDLMVMTTPDLNTFQLKYSKNKVHYVYVQHSLVSLHMAYRKDAFEHFQTIFCAGPHHKKELRAIEQTYNQPSKNIVEHGYSRLDSILELDYQNMAKNKSIELLKHVLIAPSWGENGIVETIGSNLVDLLLKNGFKVTLRPHPQTIKLANKKVQEIVNKHRANPLFHLEEKISSYKSLYESSLMISDWSGAALDYALGFKKPVLFIDVPKKINNIDYKEIGIEPLEVSIRSKIGTIISLDKLEDIKLIINELLEGYISQDYAQLSNNAIYNLHYADRVGAEELEKLINENVK